MQKILGIEKQEGFCNGIMVFPCDTKGLRIDAVVLWQPDKERYGENKGSQAFVCSNLPEPCMNCIRRTKLTVT